jgi:hypothetical protein
MTNIIFVKKSSRITMHDCIRHLTEEELTSLRTIESKASPTGVVAPRSYQRHRALCDKVADRMREAREKVK